MSKPKRSTQSPLLYMIIIITSELIYNKTSNNRVQTCENWGIELHGSGIKGCNLFDQGWLAMKTCKRRRLKERKLEEIKMDGSSGLVKRRPTNKIYKRSSTPQSHPFTMSQSNCPFSLFPIPFKTIQSSHFLLLRYICFFFLGSGRRHWRSRGCGTKDNLLDDCGVWRWDRILVRLNWEKK